MKINGTLMNYFFHCKRQCYLFGNRLNLEDNSETVKIGKALHDETEEKYAQAELEIENVKLDGLTGEYLIEIKKSDADIEASKWQLLLYLQVLRDKGIERKGKLEFLEKNKQLKKTILVSLNSETEAELKKYEAEIETLLEQGEIPPALSLPKCRKCAYFEYCYI